MTPVAQVVLPGAALVAACVLVACLGAVVVVALVRSAHLSRGRRAAFDTALTRSREEVESLSRRVEELSEEVVRARRTADQDREYVITSLGSPDPDGADPGEVVLEPVVGRQPVGSALEDQLVEALARQPRSSTVRRRAVELVVRAVAVTHGVRRALSADVLDRAAAEAHVARRRSRRDRKRHQRSARRVPDDAGPGQEVA